MASTYLTQSGTAGGSTTKFTKSFWIKRSGLGTQNYIFDNSGTAEVLCQFKSDDKFNFGIYDSGAYSTELISTQVFRDCSGWYNFVIAVDYTSGTQAHRARVYVNGTEITAWDTETRPSDATTTFDTWNSSKTLYIGSTSSGTNDFNGIMSYVIHVDGTAYAPTVFGSTDATTGEWKINTSPSITYGTKGFLILKNGNTITDQSSNSNDWALGGGTLTNTEDCPDDVFNTWNALAQPNGTLSNGNTSNLSTEDTPGTLGVNKGKFYWEIKRTNTTDSIHYGICSSKRGFNKTTKQFLNGETDSVGASIYVSEAGTGATSYADSNGAFSSTSYSGVSTPSIANGDVIGMALDISTSSGTIEWFNNGVSFGSATFTYDDSVFVFPFIRLNSGATSDCNFGNGYFGTTIISSEGTNASNIGKFEYDVPTGFTALSAKGMNS